MTKVWNHQRTPSFNGTRYSLPQSLLTDKFLKTVDPLPPILPQRLLIRVLNHGLQISPFYLHRDDNDYCEDYDDNDNDNGNGNGNGGFVNGLLNKDRVKLNQGSDEEDFDDIDSDIESLLEEGNRTQDQDQDGFSSLSSSSAYEGKSGIIIRFGRSDNKMEHVDNDDSQLSNSEMSCFERNYQCPYGEYAYFSNYTFVSYAIVGILSLSQGKHLIAVTSCKDVANVASPSKSQNRNISVIKDVIAIPLIDAESAQNAIQSHFDHSMWTPDFDGNEGSEEEEDGDDEKEGKGKEDVTHKTNEEADKKSIQDALVNNLNINNNSDLAGDDEWINFQASSPGSIVSNSSMGSSPASNFTKIQSPNTKTTTTNPNINGIDGSRYTELEAKMLLELVRELKDGNMYFSRDFDMTSNLQKKNQCLSRPQCRGCNSPTCCQQNSNINNNSKHQNLNKGNSNENFLLVNGGQSPSIECELEDEDALDEPYCGFIPLWKRVDNRFWWNRVLSKPFTDAQLHRFVYPIVQGFVQQSKTVIDDKQIDMWLISRRSTERAGLRYQRRGIDDEGHVANFVETEFIIATNDNVASFVQTRGSIPLFWTQTPFAIKPAPTMSQSPLRNHAAFKKHFETQLKLYGKQVAINLADQSGKEGPLVESYKEHVQELKNKDVKYIGFDFHHECNGNKYERLSNLCEQVEQIDDMMQGFWCHKEDNKWTVRQRQKGVFRTNCIDCLDRTNVAQWVLCRHFTSIQLARMGVMYASQDHEGLQSKLSELWANNGDKLSVAYAGTAALKGNVTRRLEQDWTGILRDISRSAARLLIGISHDFFRQAMIDTVVGGKSDALAEFEKSAVHWYL